MISTSSTIPVPGGVTFHFTVVSWQILAQLRLVARNSRSTGGPPLGTLHRIYSIIFSLVPTPLSPCRTGTGIFGRALWIRFVILNWVTAGGTVEFLRNRGSDEKKEKEILNTQRRPLTGF